MRQTISKVKDFIKDHPDIKSILLAVPIVAVIMVVGVITGVWTISLEPLVILRTVLFLCFMTCAIIVITLVARPPKMKRVRCWLGEHGKLLVLELASKDKPFTVYYCLDCKTVLMDFLSLAGYKPSLMATRVPDEDLELEWKQKIADYHKGSLQTLDFDDILLIVEKEDK